MIADLTGTAGRGNTFFCSFILGHAMRLGLTVYPNAIVSKRAVNVHGVVLWLSECVAWTKDGKTLFVAEVNRMIASEGNPTVFLTCSSDCDCRKFCKERLTLVILDYHQLMPVLPAAAMKMDE